MRRLVLILFLIIGFSGSVDAADMTGPQAAVAGSAVKTLARAFIATADMAEVKANSIEKLNRMGPAMYQRQYAKHYKVFKDLPAELRKKYGFVPGLSKDRMISIIRAMNKGRIYAIIEAVPNETIAREVGGYFNHVDPEVKKLSLMQRARMAWDDLRGDMAQKPPSRPE